MTIGQEVAHGLVAFLLSKRLLSPSPGKRASNKRTLYYRKEQKLQKLMPPLGWRARATASEPPGSIRLLENII